MAFKRTIAAALAVTVGALSFAGTADARDRGDRGRYYRHNNNHNDAFIAGALGFGAGAILGGALSQPRYAAPYYYEPAPVYVRPAPVYVQPAPVYYSREPWTDGWYAYCDSRYRSFNARTGYFVGYDGQYHFCQ